MHSNFDEIVTRRGSMSVKWDTTAPDIIPMWVADMDFRAAPCIIEALQRRLDNGVFGYTEVPDEYYRAVDKWFTRRHNYSVPRSWIIYVPGVVPAISATIKALCPAGSGVILPTPAYNCFFSSIRNNDCLLMENKLKRKELAPQSFTYEVDFEGLERLAQDPRSRMLLLCNPHNPGGRNWSRTELERMARICADNNLVLVSDEIHCELEMPGEHFTSVMELPEEYSSRAVVFTSPTKAFNIAGLQIANIVAPDPEMRSRIDKAVNINEVCDVNPFGVTALIAAYEHGEPWLADLCRYIYGNYETLTQRLGEFLPQASIAKLEATYLAWVDVRTYGGGTTVARRMLDHGVRVAAGEVYGDDNYIRINLALPHSLLIKALDRMQRAYT